MKSITKRIISTLAICGALVLEAGAVAFGSLGKALNNVSKVDAVDDIVITSGDVVNNSGYQKYESTVDSRGWIITFGGNNKSVGTNSGNRSKCNLSSYAKYAVSPVTTSDVASAFAGTSKLDNIGEIVFTFNGGSNQTNTNVYAIYSSDGNTFSQLSLTSGTQGSSISSGTSFKFNSCSGYFALLFKATNSSGNWRIDDISITFKTTAASKYSVVFNPNGGEGSMDVVGQESASYTLPECTFTPPKDKIFDKWALGSAAGTKYAVGANVTLSEGTNTFYATWKDITYDDLPVGDYYVNVIASSYTSVPKSENLPIHEASGKHFKPLVLSSSGTIDIYTYSSNKEFKLYNGAYIKFETQSNAVIKEVIIDLGTTSNISVSPSCDSAQKGTGATSINKVYTYTPKTTTKSFQFSATANYAYPYSFRVHLAVESSLTPLQTPTNINYNGTKLQWDSVPNAIKYEVSVNGTKHDAASNELTIALVDCDLVEVVAVADGISYRNSNAAVFDYTNYGTSSSPLTPDEALTVMQKQLKDQNGYTRSAMYVLGRVANNVTASSNVFYNANFKLSSGNNLLIYKLHSEDETSLSANDLILIHGYGKYYSGSSTYEFDDNEKLNCTLLDKVTPELQSIRFKAGSTLSKKSYWTSDSWDFTGLTVEKVYDVGEPEVITTGVTFTTDKTLLELYNESATSVNITAHYVVSDSLTLDSDPITITGLTITLDTVTGISIISEPSKKEYYLGEELKTDGLCVHATFSHAAEKDITDSDDLKVTGPDMFTVSNSTTAKVEYGTFSKTISGFKVQKLTEEIPESWSLVNSDSELVVGMKFVFACSSYSVTVGGISGTYLSPVDSTFGGSKITELGSDSTIFTLEKEGNNYKFKNAAGEYLGCSGEKSVSFSGGVTTWSISISSGTATVGCTTTGNGYLKYNNQSPRFTTYKSGQNGIQIYKHVEGLSIKPIRINSATNTKTYLAGDPISADDFSINVLKNNGENVDVTNTESSKVIEIDKSTLVEGDNEITISYAGLTFVTTVTAGSYIPVTSVTLSDSSITLVEGQTHQFSATVLPDDATKPEVTYTLEGTNASSIASITPGGLLTALKDGSVTVRATADGKSDTCSVTVSKKTITTVTLKSNPTKTSYYAGNTFDAAGLVITLTYNDTTTQDVAYTGNESKFTFNKTTLAVGDSIVVGTYDKLTDKTFNISVSVSEDPTIHVTSVSVSPTSLNLTAGGATGTITATVLPADATDKSVTWSSNDETVATVSGGVVTPISEGTATITATTTDGGKTATCTVNVSAPTVPVTGVSLNTNTLALNVGGTSTLVATVAPDDATDKSVTWSSNDETVATVEGGVVTAVASGTAIITVTTTDGGKTATCAVTVTKKVTSITLSETSLTITVGDAATTLTATVSPADATDKSVTWSSDHPEIASVSSSGAVTAVKAGTAVVTATANDGSGVSASCTITVKQLATGVTLSEHEIALTTSDTPITLTTTVSPADATDKSVTWSSSDETVATVSEGVVTPVGPGTATITVKTNDGSNKTDTCEVTVTQLVTSITLSETSLTITVGDAATTLTATVSPADATDKSVTWSSDHPEIASVSSSGAVTAVKAGTAVITATANDGSGVSASCTVTVKQLATGVTLSEHEIALTTSDTPITLTATVSPADTTDKSVTWTSSDESVATVSEGVVTPVGPGTATITVKTNDGSNKTDTCVVTVTQLVSSISLNKTELTLTTDDTETLIATVLPENASDKSVIWTSSDESVATVENGVVTPVGPGTATITVTANDGSGKSATCVVTIKQLVTDITLDKTELSLTMHDDPVTITPTVSPEDASDKTLTWTSSDETVVTVVNGVVTPVGPGTAVVTATANDGSGESATCSVYVATPVSGVTLDKTSVEIKDNDSPITLTATVSPENADNKNISWTSSDESVATVENGVVTPVGVGTTTITVTTEDGNFTATCTVTVKPSVTELVVTNYSQYVDQGKQYTFDGTVVAKYSDGSEVTLTEGYTVGDVNTEGHGPQTVKVAFDGVSTEITINVIQTETPVEPYQTTAIIGGAVVGVAIICAGIFFFLKKFKL